MEESFEYNHQKPEEAQEQLYPVDTVVPEDTVVSEETVVPGETAVPEETAAPEETQVPVTEAAAEPEAGPVPESPAVSAVPVTPQEATAVTPETQAVQPKKKNPNAWKITVCIIAVICLCVSVIGGVWLSAKLNAASAEQGGSSFSLATTENGNNDPVDVTTLQNSEYDSIADIVEDVGKSVVTIITTTVEDSTYSSEALGSGVIIGEDGDELYIVTNYHVIEDATDVSVLIGEDETTATAYYKGSDSETDLAVIYIYKSDLDQETLENIKIATLGDSDSLELGDLAIAIGSPIDKSYSNTVTVGIISGLERSVTFTDEETGISTTMTLLQTDAAINPGNSGGALVNGRGEVIGINNSKIVSDDVEGMGFAIPISSAKSVIEDLINNGKVIRPYLGITGVAITADSTFAETYGVLYGVYVASVTEGLTADEGGIEVNDVIIEFNGVTVEDFDVLKEALNACEIGQEVEVTVIRGYDTGEAETVTLTLTIQEKPGDFD